MKSAARRVLLLVHPDKFLALHPLCKGQTSSEMLARDFNSEYQILKESCSHLRGVCPDSPTHAHPCAVGLCIGVYLFHCFNHDENHHV